MCLNDLFVNVAGSAARLPEHVIGHLLWNVVLLIGYQVGSFCRYIADRKVCVWWFLRPPVCVLSEIHAASWWCNSIELVLRGNQQIGMNQSGWYQNVTSVWIIRYAVRTILKSSHTFSQNSMCSPRSFPLWCPEPSCSSHFAAGNSETQFVNHWVCSAVRLGHVHGTTFHKFGRWQGGRILGFTWDLFFAQDFGSKCCEAGRK